MPFRVTDASTNARLLAQLTASRQRVARAQEQVASGKRINRPSDDPVGAGVLVRLNITQAALEQFERNSGVARDLLTAADGSLESYEQLLDKVRASIARGASDVIDANGKAAIAEELDGLAGSVLALANQRYGDRYLFGGTRQEVAPYDANGAPAATPSTPQVLRIEPDGAPLTVGFPAETVFADAQGTVFTELANAATALRGTGDPVADRAALLQSLDRLGALAVQARMAHVKVGVGLERVEMVAAQLTETQLGLAATADRTEAADFVEAALELSKSQRTLEAILQTKAVTNGRSLLDLIG